MNEVVLNKMFKDPNTGKDVYVLSIQKGDQYHHLSFTKEEYENFFYRVTSIYKNTNWEDKK